MKPPVQPKVEGGFGHERGIRRVLVNQQGQRMVRFVPARSTGSGKGCGGTGVFLPRVALNNQPKKKPSVRGGCECPQQVQSAEHAAVVVGKKQQRMMPCQPPPLELALPAEWTY
ncbi:uncharacterized protein LOC109722731 isoform X2 [Ananas comosus]|uniref:Uncharacterized protein LOC109722731 isoform X2 n=1 Tax=Ananas comosus TaxID=4615 RepID=A0A6P5GK39_ANACO|nr:uncharacterized protein LOC109722731 isoform X2 [Ananas comosus]